LADASRVLEKGVPDIKHEKPSAYYKCLLLLEGEKLIEMLPLLDDINEVGLRRALRDNDIDDDPDVDVQPIQNLSVDLPTLGDPVPNQAVPPLPPLDLWLRCIARAPSFDDLKIYVDHFTSGGKRQRGYAVRQSCGCTRGRQCLGTRAEYCAQMLVWQRMCADSGSSPAAHRISEPAPHLARQAVDGITLDDFFRKQKQKQQYYIVVTITRNTCNL